MKRTICIMVLIFSLSIGTAFAQSMSGTVREISGTVEIKPPGAADFAAASIGDSLTEETVISTGFRSTALVELGSAVITVRPLTRLTMLEISTSDGVENLNVNLQAGRVRVDVNPPAGTRASMSVSSPSATASVRGTEFWFDGKNLSVGEGSVDFRGRRGNNVTVNAGSVSGVSSDGKATYARYTGVGKGSTSSGSGDTSVDSEETVVTLVSNDDNAGLLPGTTFLDQGSSTIDVGPSPDPVPGTDSTPGPGSDDRPPGSNGGNGGNGGGGTGGVTIGIEY